MIFLNLILFYITVLFLIDSFEGRRIETQSVILFIVLFVLTRILKALEEIRRLKKLDSLRIYEEGFEVKAGEK